MQLNKNEVKGFLLLNPTFLDDFVAEHVDVGIIEKWLFEKTTDTSLKAEKKNSLTYPEETLFNTPAASEHNTNTPPTRKTRLKEEKTNSMEYISLLETLFQYPVGEYEDVCAKPILHKSRESLHSWKSSEGSLTPYATSCKNYEEKEFISTQSKTEDQTSLVNISGSLAELVVSMVKNKRVEPNTSIAVNKTCRRHSEDSTQNSVNSEMESFLGPQKKIAQNEEHNGRKNTFDSKKNVLKISCVNGKYSVKSVAKTFFEQNSQKYPCSYCKKIFLSPIYLKRHLRFTHPEHIECNKVKDRRAFPTSSKEFNDKNYHCSSVPLTDSKPLRDFSLNNELVKEESLPKDTFTPLKFATENELVNVSENSGSLTLPRNCPVTRTPSKIYRCDGKGCDKSYWSQGSLKRHQILHAAHNPFICKYCGFPFQTNADLKRHIYRHTGERPFNCEKCGKGFIQRSMLRNHIMVQHGENKTNTMQYVNFDLNADESSMEDLKPDKHNNNGNTFNAPMCHD